MKIFKKIRALTKKKRDGVKKEGPEFFIKTIKMLSFLIHYKGQ